MDRLLSLFMPYWKPLAIGLIAISIYGYIHVLQSDNARLAGDLANLKSSIAAETNKQIADNAIKHADAQTKVDIADSNHALELATRNLDRQQTTKDLKALYENNHTKSAIAGVSIMLKPADSDISKTDNTASDTERLAEVTSERDRAIADYKTLEDGCTITTLDFNLARDWIDAACGIVECK